MGSFVSGKETGARVEERTRPALQIQSAAFIDCPLPPPRGLPALASAQLLRASLAAEERLESRGAPALAIVTRVPVRTKIIFRVLVFSGKRKGRDSVYGKNEFQSSKKSEARRDFFVLHSLSILAGERRSKNNKRDGGAGARFMVDFRFCSSS